MKAGRLLIAAGAGVLLVAAVYVGCGDNRTLPVDFQGNVTSVELSGGSAATRPTAFGKALFARLDLERWNRWLTSSADAQSGVCTTTTQQRLADVLACVEAATLTTPTPTPTPTATGSPIATPTGTVTPGTPTPTGTVTLGTPTPNFQPTPNASTICSHVDTSHCTFSTQIRLAEDGEPVAVFFALDANRNGTADPAELEAFLTNPLPSRLCNGDVIEIPDVDVSFESGTATAAGAVTKQIDGCPEPTTVATRTPTRSGTPGTPTPTVTGTPPTPTPTSTPTYGAGASLNVPPSTMLAMLYGVGVAGLLLPRRRKKPRR